MYMLYICIYIYIHTRALSFPPCPPLAARSPGTAGIDPRTFCPRQRRARALLEKREAPGRGVVNNRAWLTQ